MVQFKEANKSAGYDRALGKLEVFVFLFFRFDTDHGLVLSEGFRETML